MEVGSGGWEVGSGGARGDAQSVRGLGVQRDGQPAEQVGRQVAQAEEERAVLLQPELRPGEGRRVDSEREDASRDRLRFREALFAHGLELARVEGAGEAEAEEEVGRCEQHLRAAVQPVHVRQRRGVGALGDDASDDGGDDEEQEELRAEERGLGNAVLLVAEEVQEKQVR